MATAIASYWILVVSNAALGLRLAAGVVLVVSIFGIATCVTHDANHGAFARSQWANNLVGYSLDLLGGSSMLWRQKHNNLHHGNPNVVGVDGDIDQSPWARLAPQQPLRCEPIRS